MFNLSLNINSMKMKIKLFMLLPIMVNATYFSVCGDVLMFCQVSPKFSRWGDILWSDCVVG